MVAYKQRVEELEALSAERDTVRAAQRHCPRSAACMAGASAPAAPRPSPWLPAPQAKREHEALRKARLEGFMAGFNTISMRLKAGRGGGALATAWCGTTQLPHPPTRLCCAVLLC